VFGGWLVADRAAQNEVMGRRGGGAVWVRVGLPCRRRVELPCCSPAPAGGRRFAVKTLGWAGRQAGRQVGAGAGDWEVGLDCYCDYCGENGLLVNPGKCEAMVFGNGSAWPGRRRWTLPAADQVHTCGDQVIAVVTKFKYLGVELRGNGNITKATGHRHSCMVAAQ
jgi:hypothetical protein